MSSDDYDSPKIPSFPFKGPSTPDWAKIKNPSPRNYPSQVRAHHQKKLEKDTATIWHHSDPSMIDVTALNRRNKFSLDSPNSNNYLLYGGIVFIACLVITVTILYLAKPDFVMSSGESKDKKISKSKLFLWSLLISLGAVLAVGCARKFS